MSKFKRFLKLAKSNPSVRKKLVKFAYANPEYRAQILPHVVKTAETSEETSDGKKLRKEASLRKATVKLAYNNPELRPHLLPLLKQSAMDKKAGYTRYWNVKEDFTDDEWGRILRGAEKIIKKAEQRGINIAGGSGSGRPELTEEYISLNGDASASWVPDHITDELKEEDPERYQEEMKYWGHSDQAHETFHFTRYDAGRMDFTKTLRKPYDVVVASILDMVKQVAPKKIEYSSDGKNKPEERIKVRV